MAFETLKPHNVDVMSKLMFHWEPWIYVTLRKDVTALQ
jgi:hypothetical protein